VIGGEASVDVVHWIWIMPLDGLEPVGVPGVVGPWVSGGLLTRIDAEVPLIRLGLLNESTASTVYVWLVPGVRPGSVKLVEVVCPIEVGLPSR
jgi:hypothetical protein